MKPHRGSEAGVTSVIGVEAVCEVAVDVSRVIVSVSHSWFIDGVPVKRIENRVIVLEWEIGGMAKSLFPVFVSPAGRLFLIWLMQRRKLCYAEHQSKQ